MSPHQVEPHGVHLGPGDVPQMKLVTVFDICACEQQSSVRTPAGIASEHGRATHPTRDVLAPECEVLEQVRLVRQHLGQLLNAREHADVVDRHARSHEIQQAEYDDAHIAAPHTQIKMLAADGDRAPQLLAADGGHPRASCRVKFVVPLALGRGPQCMLDRVNHRKRVRPRRRALHSMSDLRRVVGSLEHYNLARGI